MGVLAATLLAVLGSLRLQDLWWLRDETIRAGESRAANLTLILSAYTAGALASGDAALRQLAIHSRRVGGPSAAQEEWAPSLGSSRAGVTGMGSISIVDRDGVIRHSTRPEIIGQSRRDDSIVRSAIGAAADDLIVGAPFRAIVDPGGFLIPIARRLTRDDGIVEGAVIAAFVPSELRKF